MARTAFWAPAHRVRARQPLGSGAPPANIGPSVDWGGIGLQDDRIPWNTQNSALGADVFGWGATGGCKVTEAIPSQIVAANLAAAQHITNGTPMTLVSATGAGITVLSEPFYCPASGNTIPAGALAIDGLPGSGWTVGGTPNYVRFGSNDGTGLYDPTSGISRGLKITASASTTANILLSGYDFYGFPMTQLVELAAATTASTLKAFKFLTSAVPQTTDGTNTYSIGTADIYGFNLAADNFADVEVFWGSVLQTDSTFLPAARALATDLTGDVRGTFTPATASTGSIQLDIYVTPRVARIAAGTLFGVAQA